MRASDRSAAATSSTSRPPGDLPCAAGCRRPAAGGEILGYPGPAAASHGGAGDGCARGARRRDGPCWITCSGLGACLLPPDRGPPQRLGAEQDQPVDEQQDRCRGGLGEQDPEGVLEHDAGQADRDRREDDHPCEPLVLVRHCQPQPPVPQAQPHARGQAAEEAPDDPDPVSAEEPHQRQGRRAVQRHDVCQVERALAAGLRGLCHHGLPAAAEPGRDQHRMAEAGYREQFGHALDERDHQSLKIGHAGSLVMIKRSGWHAVHDTCAYSRVEILQTCRCYSARGRYAAQHESAR